MTAHQSKMQMPDWTVLLIGGPSGVGKSTAAKHLARHFGIPWLQVDDLRLALEWSRVALPQPEDTAALYFFGDTPEVWRLPPERLRDAFIAMGQALSPAIAKVVTNHVATDEPIVIEGDGVLPALLARPDVRASTSGDQVRIALVVEPDVDVATASMVEWGRGMDGLTAAEVRTRATATWLFGQWLIQAARRAGIPVMEPRPWTTLAERIVAASAPVTRPQAGDS